MNMKRKDLHNLYKKKVLEIHPDKNPTANQRHFQEFDGNYKSFKQFSAPTFNKHIGLGAGLAAIGTGLIIASKKSFNLTNSSYKVLRTLHRLNTLIENY